MIDLRLLPPGFGFHPTDEELVVHYLKGKVHDQNEEQFEIISVIDLYKYEPWDLPGKCVVPSRDGKWHFFSRRDRKYPNGARKNRATEKGYWKATGKDRNIRSAKRVVGTKKTLVFHEGRASNGKRTDWVMHEYHLDEKECSGLPAGMHESYALCRICKKNGFDLQEDAAAETEVTDPSPKEAESNCLCSPKLEGSPGTVGEITPVGHPPLGGLFEVWLKGSSSTGTEEVSTSVVQTHETQSEVCPLQHLEEGAAETEEDVEMWLNPIVDYQPDQWGQTSEGWLYSTPGPMAATVPLQSSEIVLGDNFQPPKPECFVAAANQEFPVAYQYQEAESSIHGKLGRPDQVPAENSETDVNVEALLAEMYKAEDSVAAADQEFPVGYEYQEAESRFHDELVRPDQIPAENSETDVNVEALLAELYKAEDSVAAVDQEFPVGYEYQEAESSFHGELARPDQVPAENSEIDVNVESLLAELYKAEDSVAAVDQEFPVGYEYQESESGFHGELVRPDQVPVENSETDLNEEDLLAELYMAATGMRLRLNSYPASDGVSLSDLGVHEEPATNETGVQIRRRHLELPEEFISQGPRIIMQVYKMESAATGAVKTCTFEDQTVSVREHDDSNYKPGEKKPFPLENSSKKSSIQIGELHVLKNSSSSSELPNSVCKLTPAKVIASDVLQSEANACTVSTTVKSISGTPGSSKTGGSSFFSGTIRTWLSPSSRTKEAVADTAAVDCEQASGGGCSFMFHLRRYVSTGLCWVLPAFCVLGTSLHCY